MNILAQKLDSFMAQALAEGTFPGGELLFAQGKEILHHQAWGTWSPEDRRPLEAGAWWDLASLTKPLVTATCLLHLLETGAYTLSDKLARHLPEFDRPDTQAITLKDLLTHVSGFAAWDALFLPNFDPAAARTKLMNLVPQSQPGQTMVYSCLNYLLLAQVLKSLTGVSLQDYFMQRILLPLGLTGLSFHPPKEQTPPTSICPLRGRLLQGEVHDQNAACLGKDAGNSGLFGTALGVYELVRTFLAEPFHRHPRPISQASLGVMLANHNPPPLDPRSLGWDIRHTRGYQSSGDLMPIGVLGHLGYTGTSLWFVPQTGLVVIFLSHRVALGEAETQEKIRRFRPRLHNLLLSSL